MVSAHFEMLRRSHDCDRCGTSIRPGDEYAAVDGITPAGDLRVLLCTDCAAALGRFLDGGDGGDRDDDGAA
ncbi:hypothetical protein [Halobaculum limi]|uniref:hypothetical protein n=1 Tax=Halobaculum limi TaxID=3031916 RepID=UPI00240711ED|nr:hypothetical protein [Halobaculum sp. YSMS11]